MAVSSCIASLKFKEEDFFSGFSGVLMSSHSFFVLLGLNEGTDGSYDTSFPSSKFFSNSASSIFNSMSFVGNELLPDYEEASSEAFSLQCSSMTSKLVHVLNLVGDRWPEYGSLDDKASIDLAGVLCLDWYSCNLFI